MAEQRIAIIGRGLAGLTLGFRMVEAGYRPTLLGAAQGPSNASRCAQGIVCNKGLIFAESPLFRAKLQTLKKLEGWLAALERISGEAIARTWIGADEPYWSDEDFQKTVRRVYRGNFWGCYRPQNCSPRSWPAGFQTPEGYLHYPDDAWFDVNATMNALEKACALRGVTFVDEKVRDLCPLLASFDHIVVAAGADTMRLLETLQLALPKSFHVGGQSLHWPHPPLEAARILVKGTISLAYLRDRSILGSSTWKPEAGETPHLVEDRQALLQQAAGAFGLPLPHPDEVESQWGIRLRFADRMPALGLWPAEGLTDRLSVLTGFYKNGLQLADLCAEQLLKELEGKALDEWGEAFHVRRFFRSGRRPLERSPTDFPLHPSKNHAGA